MQNIDATILYFRIIFRLRLPVHRFSPNVSKPSFPFPCGKDRSEYSIESSISADGKLLSTFFTRVWKKKKKKKKKKQLREGGRERVQEAAFKPRDIYPRLFGIEKTNEKAFQDLA